jgi:hypothetical protein
MASKITLYNSYKKGLNTVVGSFPVCEDILPFNCVVDTTFLPQSANLLDLYERDYDFYIIAEESTLENQILFDVDTIFSSKPYNLIVNNNNEIQLFLQKYKKTKFVQSLITTTNFYEPTFQEEIPTVSFVSTTPPPRPCVGRTPCRGATLTVDFTAGSYGGVEATSVNIYVSRDNELGMLVATLFKKQGRYTITDLIGDTTYKVTVVNNFNASSGQITEFTDVNPAISSPIFVTTPHYAYVYITYLPGSVYVP